MDNAKQVLGWQPSVTLEEGMALTAPWLKSES
jgi:nucleoside-diphosphate-sugar epimerase